MVEMISGFKNLKFSPKTRRAALIGMAALLMPFAAAKAQVQSDSIISKSVPVMSKPSISFTAYTNNYSDGNPTQLAVGGSVLSTVFGRVDLSFSASGGPSGKIICLQQAEFDAGIGPVTAYVYKDDFLGIKEGIGVFYTKGNSLFGAERSDGGVTTAYAKYLIGTKEAFVRPMLGALTWDGFTPKMVVAEVTVQQPIFGWPFYTRVMKYLQLSDGHQSLNVQLGVTKEF